MTDDWTSRSAYETTRSWVRSPPPRHGPGLEPTSVTHETFLYNSIYRFDHQAAAPPPASVVLATEKMSICASVCVDDEHRMPMLLGLEGL
jgi:hypothetical protein